MQLPNESGLTSEIVSITPEIAADMLETGWTIRNRTVNSIVVDRYADDMRKGLWTMTGEAVKFDREGHLLDGQHRLWAIIESGCTIPILVVRGIEYEHLAEMDTGRKRTPQQWLEMHDYKYTGDLIGTINQLEAFKHLGHLYNFTTGERRKWGRKTNAEYLAYVREHDGLYEALLEARRYYHKSVTAVSPSVLTTLLILFQEKSHEDAHYFWDRFATGVGLTEGSPILLYRNMMMRWRQEGHKGQKFDAYLTSAYGIKAWNFFRRGETIGQLKFIAGGSKPEPYPVIE